MDEHANQDQNEGPANSSPGSASGPEAAPAGPDQQHDQNQNQNQNQNQAAAGSHGGPRPPRSPREDRLFLADDLKLRPAVTAAFERILSRAGRQLERVDTEPAKAVHEFRKSVRRARALLALFRPSLRTRDYRAIANGLRTAHRATSGLRDSDVLLATLASLKKAAAGEVALEQASERWRGHLAQRSGAGSPPAQAAAVLRDAAKGLPHLSERFSQALPQKTSWRDVARGLRRTLRRAQKARAEAVGAGRDEALHDWRKRVKELNYQLEVLTRGSTIGPVATRKQFADLAESLGKITDRLVLREALAETAAGSEDGPDGPSGDDLASAARRLAELATTDLERRRTALIAESDELMAKPSREFVALLVAEARSARSRVRSRSAA